MATLVLAIGGSVLAGSAATAIGVGAVAANIITAVGGAVGGFIGGAIDNALLGVGNKGRDITNSTVRLDQQLTATYGKIIPIGYGTVRIAGNVIWQSDARVQTTTQTQKVRTGKFSSSTVTTGQTRTVKVDLLIALLGVPSTRDDSLTAVDSTDEDEITISYRKGIVAVTRLWFGSELVYDARTINSEPQSAKFYTLSKIYDGQEGQQPDTYIEGIEGANQVPAFRGISMVLIRDFDLTGYGERIPNINVEVIASLPRITVEDGPSALVEGTDGNVYCLNRLQRTVSQVNPDNLRVSITLQRNGYTDYLGGLKSQPTRMAVDTVTGNLWITCNGDACVQVLNPFTDVLITTIPTAYYPHGIAQDGNGDFWVTFPMGNKIGRINRTTYAYTEFTCNGAPWEIIKGSTGNLWITSNTDLIRINHTNGAELARIAINFFCSGLCLNAVTGEVWLCNTGLNILQVVKESTNTIVKLTNTGTYPIDIDSHKNDSYGSVALATLYGNQLKTLSKSYNELADYGTVSFPSQVLHLDNGRIFMTQYKYNFIQAVDTR